MSRRKNRLRQWFALRPRPMTKLEFARQLGVTSSYVSQLTKDSPPWPSRELQRQIGIITNGFVTPNDLAGYQPEEPETATSPGD